MYAGIHILFTGCYGYPLLLQVTKSMAGVVKGMDSALKSMNLEKVGLHCKDLVVMVHIMRKGINLSVIPVSVYVHA